MKEREREERESERERERERESQGGKRIQALQKLQLEEVTNSAAHDEAAGQSMLAPA